MKVGAIWRMFSMILIGFSIGVFITIKYISPPSQDINIGKIQVKGRKNDVSGLSDIMKKDEANDDNSSSISGVPLSKKDIRKAKRQAKKTERKGQDSS